MANPDPRRWRLAPLLACAALGCGRIEYQPQDGALDDAESAMDAGLDAGVDGGGDAGPPDGGFDPTRPLVADCSHRWIETTDIDSDFTHVLAAATTELVTLNDDPRAVTSS